MTKESDKEGENSLSVWGVAMEHLGGFNVVKKATEALGTLFGPALKESGLFLAEFVTRRRVRNQIDFLAKMQPFTAKSGQKINVLTDKILSPLIESISIEDDEVLINKWKNLIEDAVVSESQDLHVLYANILKQITATQAKMLDKIYDMQKKWEAEHTQGSIEFHTIPIQLLFEELECNKAQGDIFIDHLTQVNVIEYVIDTADGKSEFGIPMMRMHRSETIRMTSLGKGFVAACSDK